MPRRLTPFGFALRGDRVARISLVWVCAALVYLGVSEWRVWTQVATVRVTASNMGTGLLAGLSGLLVVQVVAMLVFGFLSRGWRLPAVANVRPTRNEILLVLAATAIGAGLRLAALQDVPAGLWYDTAENGNQALRILHDPSYRPVFIAEATQLPALFVYLDAFSINLFGAEAFAVRLPSALFGAATVPAMWWLGRQLGGPALGVVAAFALATSRWHIDFSRLALASIVTPFALTLALAATLAALRARTPNARIGLSVVAGVAISLGLWSYPASILSVPAVAGGVVWWIGRGQPRTATESRTSSEWYLRLRRASLVLGVVAASCIISLEPLVEWTVRNPATVLQRPQAVAVAGNATHDVIESAVQHVLMFTVSGDRNGRHNTPARPELGWFAPLFLAGVGAAAWRVGSGISLAVPAALLFLASGILTLPFEAPQSHRAILALVPASLLVALPVALVWSRHRLLAQPMLGVVVIAGVVEAADYFQAQLQESAVYLENSLLETHAGRWLRTLGPNAPILSVERFRSHPTVRFLSGEHPSLAAPGTALSEFLPLDGSQSVALLTSFDEPALFDRALALYPQAPMQTFRAPLGEGQPLIAAMFVSRELQEQTRGFRVETGDGSLVTVPALAGSDAHAWSATMRVLASGDYSVESGGSSVAIDGEPVISTGQSVEEVFLARGAHAIHIVRPDGAPSPQLQVSLVRAALPIPGFSPPPAESMDPLFFALPPPGGLLFAWQIEGRPVQALVDSAPHRGFEGTFNDGRRWTAQWLGRLRVDQPGEYGFRMEAITSAVLFIDGQQILRSDGDSQITLTQGVHTIRVDYVDRDPYARLFLNWRPPGETEFTAIPDAVLIPALRLS